MLQQIARIVDRLGPGTAGFVRQTRCLASERAAATDSTRQFGKREARDYLSLCGLAQGTQGALVPAIIFIFVFRSGSNWGGGDVPKLCRLGDLRSQHHEG